MNRPKRIAAIHDLSGVGRCSLTVIIPTLSAMGMQVCPVPTAIFSTHTGGFGEVAMRDLTEYLPAALDHYKRIGMEFECIYSGFLGSFKQIDCCLDYFQSWSSALVVVDPVMGDHGRPYRTMTDAMCRRMHEMVEKADVITPNLTEACLLLGEEYSSAPMMRSQAKSRLTKLARLGPRQVVITGVQLAEGIFANVGYDRISEAFWCVPFNNVAASYPGTGDLFASVLTGSLLSGDSLPMAMCRAARFVEDSIKTTFGFNGQPREGVMFERLLDKLVGHETHLDYQVL